MPNNIPNKCQTNAKQMPNKCKQTNAKQYTKKYSQTNNIANKCQTICQINANEQMPNKYANKFQTNAMPTNAKKNAKQMPNNKPN